MKRKRSKRDPDHTPPSTLDAAIHKVFAQYGKQGGRARAESLTSEQRSALAKRAAEARWHADRVGREAEWKRFRAAKSPKSRTAKGK